MDEGYLRISEPDNAPEELLIRFADRNTKCYLSARRLKQNHTLTPDDLRHALATKKVTIGLDESTLQEVCTKVNQGKPVQNILVAQGSLPQTGRDGFFEFKIKPFSLTPEYDENNQGKIDYHETHLFENVNVGQTIGILWPPVPGKEGITVTGERIAPAPVKKISVRAGQGVEKIESDNMYIATKIGRVTFIRGILSVTEEFLVEKDVDFSVGHIDFLGFVQVRGDVLDGFNIHAKKGIQIAGNVGEAKLESEGDIALGGMSVRENEGFIKCGGNLTASYLSNVIVECEGNVHVHREVVNCIIHCNGAVYIDGRLVGGECIALGGLEADQIGTDMGVKTYIVCGDDYHYYQQIRDLKLQLADTQQRLQSLKKVLESEEQQTDFAELPAESKKLINKNLRQIKKLQIKESTLKETLHLIRHASQNYANPKINVKSFLHPGAFITLDCVYEEIKDPHPGPCSLIAYQGKKIYFLEMTPLSKKAEELEKEIISPLE